MKNQLSFNVSLTLLLTSPLLVLATGCNFNQSSLSGAFSNSDANGSSPVDALNRKKPRPTPSPSPSVSPSPTPSPSPSVSPSPSPSPSVSPSPKPSPSPSVSPSPMPSPSVIPPASIGSKVTDIKVYATSSTVAQSNVPITFGIPFPKGVLPSGTSAVLRDPSNQSIIPTQFEIKAKHDDGSARHAIVTAVLPQIGAGATMNLDLVAAQTAVQTPVDVATLFSKGFTTSVSVTISGVVYQATLNASNYASLQKGTWLKGALATEGLFKVPLTANGSSHPLLHARFYVRAYQGGTSARVGVAVENTDAYTAPSNVTYDLQVQMGGRTVLSQAAVPHYAHSRWYRTFNYGTQPNVTVGLNPQFLLSSPAVPHYDPSLKIAESAIADWASKWSTSSGLMQIGPVVAYMPTTGGRPDIGPLPSWSAMHVISQDPRMYDVTVGTGIQAGSWSMHYRDTATDLPLSIDRYPYSGIYATHGDTYNPVTKQYEDFPACASDCTTPYRHDPAHEPSLVYYPYLITGDYYLLEELVFWGAYNLFEFNPYYRNFSDGLVFHQQVRGQAWDLRSFSENAYILPDDHPYKAYFTDKLLKNLAWFDNKYVKNTDNALGIVTDAAMVYNSGIGMAPWQQHFFTWSIGNAYRMGFTTSKNFLTFLSKFQTSIMTDPNYCWIEASAYSMNVRASSTTSYYTSFGDVYKNTVDPTISSLACGSQAMATALGLKVGEMVGYSSSTEGFPSNSQPALAVLVDGGAPNAQAAWNQYMSRSVKPDYSTEPVWAIVPAN